MPTFTAGAFGADFDQIDVGSLNTGTASGETTTAFAISVGPQLDQFTGTGFTFGPNGFPLTGIITDIQETFAGQLVFSLDGLSLPVAQFINWVGTGANETAKLTIFAGADLINGSDAADLLRGYGGDDTESGGPGADIFHGSQDAGIDKVLDFHLSEGDRVMLDPGTTFTVSQVGADTVIDMGPSPDGSPNQMILVGVQMSTLTGNWIFEG